MSAHPRLDHEHTRRFLVDYKDESSEKISRYPEAALTQHDSHVFGHCRVLCIGRSPAHQLVLNVILYAKTDIRQSPL